MISYHIRYNNIYYDISDYVRESEAIPIIYRNIDYTLTTKGFNCKVWLVNNYPENYYWEADRVIVKANNIVVFVGVISGRTKDYDNHLMELEISNIIKIMDNYYLTYAELNDILTDTTNPINYRATDNYGLPNVSLLWVIQSMFSIAGLSFLSDSTKNLGTLVVTNNKLVYEPTYESPAIYRSFQLRDLRLDLNMLYAINQSGAMNHNNIDNDLPISFFDFISLICSLFHLSYHFDNYEFPTFVFVAEPNEESYLIEDDYKYSYQKEEVQPRDNNYKWHIEAQERTNYLGALVSLVPIYHYSGVKATQIDYYTNMVFLLQGKWAGATEGDVYPYATTPFTNGGYNWLCPADNLFGRASEKYLTGKYYKHTYKTNIRTNFVNVLSNEIAPDGTTSIIKEVEFV